MEKSIAKEQAWFWTRRWQEGEKEAEEDIRAGRIHRFDNVEDAIAFLRNRARSERRGVNTARDENNVD